MLNSRMRLAFGTIGGLGRAARYAALAASLVAAGSGCFAKRCGATCDDCEPSYIDVAQQIDPPDVCLPVADEPECTPEPRSLRTVEPGEQEYWDVPLEEVIHYGLSNSRVLIDVGGTVVRTPDAVQTNLSPIITQMDPRFGVEAALSAFDLQYNLTGNFEKNDRAINNQFAGGGTREFLQDLNVYRSELVKKNATGAQMAVRNVTEYDANNAPANLFPSAWTTYWEGEIRQPLLQGAGVRFNRIAGPNATPGVYNGVVIARVNADISQADFEVGVREYLSNLENAYWDLYYAYRDLDAKIAARDAALATWRRYEALEGQGATQGYREAQARDQYYRFEQEVKNALTGRRLEGTRTYNGSPGGTFRATPGVYLAERRLRLLMGIPATDARIIRPRSEPLLAQVVYVWDAARDEAIQRRPELHRARFRVQRAELELVASRNFLKPRLDAVGRYRYRGFGKDLAFSGDGANFGDAAGNLGTGNYQEWLLGFEMNAPLGFRKGHSAVAHAEYRLAKERALLHEQERQVVHDLSNAVAEVDRAYEIARLAYDRRDAAHKNLGALTALEQQEQAVSLDTLLDAQRRVLDADTQFHQALVEYQLAVKNVNLEKGSLLDYHNILTSDEASLAAESAETSAAETASVSHPEATRTLPAEAFAQSAPEADGQMLAETEDPADAAPPAESSLSDAPATARLIGPNEDAAPPAESSLSDPRLADTDEPVSGVVSVADLEDDGDEPSAIQPTSGQDPGKILPDVEFLDAPPGR